MKPVKPIILKMLPLQAALTYDLVAGGAPAVAGLTGELKYPAMARH